MNKYFKFFIFQLYFILFLSGCVSLNQPKKISEPINYSDENVVENEIKTIREIRLEDCTKALWRAMLLNNKDIILECQNIVYMKLEEALENKNYFDTRKYYLSLKTVNFNFDSEIEDKVLNLSNSDVPGLTSENPKPPKNISDCLNATCTIWVDRGIQVKNGAGYADIIIGSGFFIDKRGYLVTNHHVIESMVNPKYEGFSRLYIKLLSDSDTKIPAKVIGFDPVLDLALLKVEIEPEYVLSLGSSKDLSVGDKVSAIGTPIGLEGTLTSGIVSATDRKLTSLGNVFQIDAAINSGNSGGPLIDENLNVQAVVFAGMLQFQGLNFAVPVEYLKQELPVLYNNSDSGEVIHNWLCAYGHTYRNGNKKAGLEVQYVMPGGSAFLSGLKSGDVITEIDGNLIKSIDDYHFLMMKYQYGTILNCKFLRDNEEKTCLIFLENRPKDPLNQIYKSDLICNSFVPIFGMKLIPASTMNHNSYKIESIIKGSVADQMSFSENDFVTVRDVKFDNDKEYFIAQISTQRRKKGFLDISMILSASYDSPYYF